MDSVSEAIPVHGRAQRNLKLGGTTEIYSALSIIVCLGRFILETARRLFLLKQLRLPQKNFTGFLSARCLIKAGPTQMQRRNEAEL